MDAAVLERAYEAFQEFHGYFAPVFGRKEARENSSHYLQALLVQSEERRNAENLSETVPASPRALQRFLSESPWDDDAVIDRLQEYLSSRLKASQGVWVLDGSDFPKQGMKSAGWSGSTAGRWARSPTAKQGCFWPTWGPGDGRWWTRGCICRRNGLGTGSVVRRRECRRTDGSTEARLSWRWICWSAPRPEATSAHSGWLEIPLSGCRRRCGRASRPRNVLRFGRASGYDGLAAGTDLDRSALPGQRASPQTQTAA